MKLLIDIGNSRIKWAWSGSHGLGAPGDYEHRGQTAKEAMAFVDALEQRPDRVVVVNVAGDAIETQLVAELQDRFAIPTEFVRTSRSCGKVRNGYSDIRQLGTDRWAAVVGAWQRVKTDVCVVDAGTAVTIDFVAADGQHLGGLIVPGAGLMQGSLLAETGNIAEFAELSGKPGGSGVAQASWFAKNTREAISFGARLSTMALVERAFADFVEQRNGAMLLLTGGDAAVLGRALRVAAEVRPLLVLEGLDVLTAELNTDA